jgi:hypothetical protein
LLHNFRSHADHVSVADLAAFDDADDGHARAEFAGLRRHAHRAYVANFESLQDIRRGRAHRTWTKIFEEQPSVSRVTVFNGGGDAGGDGAAGFVGDKRNMLAGTNAEASFHGVLGAGHQLWVWVAKVHLLILQESVEI